MPALNISEEHMDKIEELRNEVMEVSPTKKELGEKAVDDLYEKMKEKYGVENNGAN